jgi:hypothetical protein
MKKKKLDSIPKINRRLFKLWSEAVRKRAGYKCEFCGIERGSIGENGKKIKVDAHHLMSRNVSDSPMKFEILNGISLCPKHHKFSPDSSFHMNPVMTMDWLQKNIPERFKYVLENYLIRVNLHNREILEEIEARLLECKSIDLNRLIELNKKSDEKSEETTETTEKDLTKD